MYQMEDFEINKASRESKKNYINKPLKHKTFGFKNIDQIATKQRILSPQKLDFNLPNNKIKTSKYNIFTFIPLNLIEQFSKLANLYFLIIAIMQTVHEISNSEGKPVILVPLTTIIFISAIKDLFEDLKRHKLDEEENNRKILVYENGVFKEKKWRELRCGNIVKVKLHKKLTKGP